MQAPPGGQDALESIRQAASTALGVFKLQDLVEGSQMVILLLLFCNTDITFWYPSLNFLEYVLPK